MAATVASSAVPVGGPVLPFPFAQGGDPAAFDSAPLMPPPRGVSSNFEGPFSLAPTAKAVTFVTATLMVATVCLRFWARVLVTRDLGVDDALLLAGVVTTVAYCTLSVLSNGYLGLHSWNVHFKSYSVSSLKTITITVPTLYTVSIILIKSSLFTLYLRIFQPSRKITLMTWAGLAFTVLGHSALLVLNFVLCRPSQWSGDDDEPPVVLYIANNARCEQTKMDLTIADGVIGALTDTYLMVVPISAISGLNMSHGHKKGAIAVSRTVLCDATLCSLASLHFHIIERTSADYSWHEGFMTLLRVVELNAGIISASIPVAWIVIKTIIRNCCLRKMSWKRSNSAEGTAPTISTFTTINRKSVLEE
ncbi:hypothetical protein QBC35DRAFT_392402 [Podospora australis]|uniref:Rhodopsin domain-containing protein n=1 Tax=Podospora australis TaxID=1536484 RepID=A0AAN6WML9_9PEZI|nr:hypothetical protein QBC35DRAFT_392402 [Podospora australis]